MSFKPDTRQLSTIADMITARMPTARIAAELGVSETEFAAWAGRLAAKRTMDAAALYSEPPWRWYVAPAFPVSPSSPT
jgi:hypothetical protein